MLSCKFLYDLLKRNNIDFYTGVPDSLLKEFCAYLTENAENNIITANEGNAVAVSAGHYLATKKIGVVYMQNSGIGNVINPLISLLDEEVYNIPVLFFVGWRGEPNVHDEPQHIKQGKVTKELFDTCYVQNQILSDNQVEAEKQVLYAIDYMKKTLKPFAFIVRKGTFEKYSKKQPKDKFVMTREEAIGYVLQYIKQNDVIVSTTGQISRELYEYRENNHLSHNSDFLTVGSMGHTSSIAVGIALEKPNKKVYCFDGDGAVLMHMGSIPVNASLKLRNFKHILFNNEAHDSVGGQKTVSDNVDFVSLMKSCGYEICYSVSTKQELEKVMQELINSDKTSFLEIKVNCGARSDLGRPKEKPITNKENFMEFLNEN